MGGGNGIVVKVNPNNEKIWEFTRPVSFVSAVAVDVNRNVYAAGFDKAVRKIRNNTVLQKIAYYD